MNARASENYLAISSKSVEIFWAEIYWGRLFFRAESSPIQSSCRSFIRVIVPYDRGYETSGSPLRFMLRRSSLVECVSVLHGTGVYKASIYFLFVTMFSHVCQKYTFYTTKSSITLAYKMQLRVVNRLHFIKRNLFLPYYS